MKALVQNGYGSDEMLEFQDLMTPVPDDHEVLVKVCATAINDWECGILKPPLLLRLFLGLRRPRGKFRIMGCDMAGIVECVGCQVKNFKPGDRVYGDLSGYRFGGFAEFVCVTEQHLAQMPHGLSFAQAAAIPHAAELALQAIQTAPQLKPGQKVLINGAGGGVGTLALQILKQKSVDVSGVDYAAKLEFLESQGFDHVIEYPTVNFTRTGIQYDFILDTKTSESAVDYLRALKPGGVYATVGGSKIGSLVLQAIFLNRFTDKQLKMIALKPNKNLTRINDLVDIGILRPVIDRVFQFTEIREALSRFARAEHKGKIIINII